VFGTSASITSPVRIFLPVFGHRFLQVKVFLAAGKTNAVQRREVCFRLGPNVGHQVSLADLTQLTILVTFLFRTCPAGSAPVLSR
jgi:hypothetical protein